MLTDRREAGQRLAHELRKEALHDPVVLALPRGGVPVAAEIAAALSAPLDLILVRKVGAPGQPELAAAAVVDAGEPQLVRNEPVVEALHLSQRWLDKALADTAAELARRRRLWRGERKPPSLEGRTAVIVDDGIATGTTARSALIAVRRAGPASVVLAVPVAPEDTLRDLEPLVDRLVCLMSPKDFFAVGQVYRDFSQVDDEAVAAILGRHG
jgi:putative phosphoribosyl transferase